MRTCSLASAYRSLGMALLAQASWQMLRHKVPICFRLGAQGLLVGARHHSDLPERKPARLEARHPWHCCRRRLSQTFKSNALAVLVSVTVAWIAEDTVGVTPAWWWPTRADSSTMESPEMICGSGHVRLYRMCTPHAPL